jgi:hypothetical protein
LRRPGWAAALAKRAGNRRPVRPHGAKWLEATRQRFSDEERVYRGMFKSLRWEWPCARLELLMSEQGDFLCQWVEHPSARRLPELQRIDEVAELATP